MAFSREQVTASFLIQIQFLLLLIIIFLCIYIYIFLKMINLGPITGVYPMQTMIVYIFS